jgi:hypothetical protein
MKQKKDLAKIALSALLLASTASANATVFEQGSQEVLLLAKSCGANCAAVADNFKESQYPYNQNSPYQPNQTDIYRSNSANPYGSTSTNGNDSNYYNNPYGSSNNSSSYSPNASTSDSSVKTEWDKSGNNNSAGTVNTYQSTTRSASYGSSPSNSTYKNDGDYSQKTTSTTTTSSQGTLTEAKLLALLTPQGRAIYLSLDPEGKAMAIQLASQDSYKDKNLAVSEAQYRMNTKRGLSR